MTKKADAASAAAACVVVVGGGGCGGGDEDEHFRVSFIGFTQHLKNASSS